MLNLHLGYRINRFFSGEENGLVVKVKELSSEKGVVLDDLGKPPLQITFENPLGELITIVFLLETYSYNGLGLSPDKSYLGYE